MPLPSADVATFSRYRMSHAVAMGLLPILLAKQASRGSSLRLGSRPAHLPACLASPLQADFIQVKRILGLWGNLACVACALVVAGGRCWLPGTLRILLVVGFKLVTVSYLTCHYLTAPACRAVAARPFQALISGLGTLVFSLGYRMPIRCQGAGGLEPHA